MVVVRQRHTPAGKQPMEHMYNITSGVQRPIQKLQMCNASSLGARKEKRAWSWCGSGTRLQWKTASAAQDCECAT
jgi:hypothetical protein